MAESSVKGAGAAPDRLLPWHSTAWSRLVQWRRADRLPHGLRLTGPAGVGKRVLAESLAAWLLCEAVRVDGGTTPCGDCKQCRLVRAGSHPDLQSCRPESSRYIRIDQIRALGDFLSQSPQVAGRKVVIIDRADQLNLNAANALLKTLEEPADDANLILLHDEGRPLRPTIRSRCQTVAVRIPGREQAWSWLTARSGEGEGFDPRAAAAALDLAGGAPLLAYHYLANGHLSERGHCLQALRSFLKREVAVIDAVKPFVEAGLETTLEFMAHWALDMARLGQGQDASDTAAREMLAFLARHNSQARVQDLYATLCQCRARLDYNLNPTLEIEQLLMRWRHLMPAPGQRH